MLTLLIRKEAVLGKYNVLGFDFDLKNEGNKSWKRHEEVVKAEFESVANVWSSES